MGARNDTRSSNARSRIAQEAARVMIDGGIEDYRLAKRKALERLRLADTTPLPGNDEIELAVQEYQRLFRADRQPQQLSELRRVAIEAMNFLSRFRPRLVGPVLTGTADEHSELCLHVFADPPEEVDWFLMEHGIRFETGERRLRVSSEDSVRLPTYCFVAQDVPVVLVVFSGRSRRQPPLSPVDGKPMRRANVETVKALAGERS